MRRQYAGGAKPAQLTANLGNSTADLTITCDDLSNWPDGSIGPFYVVIDRGLAAEEKILCVSRTSNTITVYNTGLVNGRGADGTSVVAHSSGATIEHVFTATDADEANAHVNSSSAVHGIAGSVVGTSDSQTLTNKTLTSPIINDGTVDSATITNSTISDATISTSTFSGGITTTSVVVTGSQTLAHYRVRNTYATTTGPTAGDGNDGDLWIQYEA